VAEVECELEGGVEDDDAVARGSMGEEEKEVAGREMR
jgi:hypothetical protein